MSCILQRADDRLEQRAALAHQHQNVAVAHGAPVRCRPARRSIQLRTCAAMRRASLTRGLVSLAVSNGASQPSISRSLVRLRPAAQISTRPGGASGSADVRRNPSRRSVTLAESLPAAEHCIDRAEHARRRNGTNAELDVARSRDPAVLDARASKCRRISANSRGAAPWNEKIDCFSSPTAKIVRLTLARARAGGELGDQRAGRSPTASGWCPAPRRSAGGRCRDRACSAPRRRRRCASSASVLSIRSS